MGIVDLWKLISPSEKKFTLEQISADTGIKKQGKVLRVAIDVAIWTFQAKASVAGDQSELRSLFFRFNRLYELGIRPVFVFDGPHRPDYKRNKVINTEAVETTFRRNLIHMIELFNFSMWQAYGEAEAECALLQRLGFVDMIFTGDSDAFLFGARRVIRQWPSKRNEQVLCYDIAWITDHTGLDRSDLILIALLRGSDYDTAGTRGIGINTAAQLSKCHFHRALMDDIQLAGREHSLDDERVQHLFDDLTYELHNNSKRNLNKRSGVTLDRNFFEFRIVIDFIHPPSNITSNDPKIISSAQLMKHNLDYYHEPNWMDLATFAQNCFSWPAEYVLKRFSSLLYPGYMANRLRRQQPNYSLPPKISTHTHKESNNTRQTQLQDYYRSTPRLHRPATRGKQFDLIQITGSKISKDNLKLYRVEWSKSTWVDFQRAVKEKLNYDCFQDAIIADEEIEAEEAVAVNAKDESAQDSFQLVKRQWVDANQIHSAYPSIALDYQQKTSKKSLDPNRQTKIDSFLILPVKRRLFKK